MSVTRQEFFADMKRSAGSFDELWEARAERLWASREKAAAWFDQPLPAGCCIVFDAHQEPAEWRSWDLYSLDDYDTVCAVPPGLVTSIPDYLDGFGSAFNNAEVTLPNGWRLFVRYHS